MNPQRLKTLCLEQICRDFLRHSMAKKQTRDEEVSRLYSWFFKVFSDDVQGLLCERLKEEQKFLKTRSALYSACLNFVFNGFVKVLTFYKKENQKDCYLDRRITSAIRKNCKVLAILRLQGMSLPWSFHLNFLKSLKNLVTLDLSWCSFEVVPTMKAIADSLRNLRDLSLEHTEVDDEGLFTLCGHKNTDSTKSSQCSVIETYCIDSVSNRDDQESIRTCKTLNKIRLRRITLTGTKISHVGLMCVLTHIQTLKYVVAESRMYMSHPHDQEAQKISQKGLVRCPFIRTKFIVMETAPKL